MNNEPQLISGGLAVDDRGALGFINDLNLHQAGIQRFYRVTNHTAGFVRAWHAHRHEAKYVTVMAGAALVGAVAIDNWETPSRDATVHRHVLSANKPGALYIPAGYANGFMSLTADTVMVFFSTTTLEESAGDDIRYESRYWDIWNVVER